MAWEQPQCSSGAPQQNPSTSIDPETNTEEVGVHDVAFMTDNSPSHDGFSVFASEHGPFQCHAIPLFILSVEGPALLNNFSSGTNLI